MKREAFLLVTAICTRAPYTTFDKLRQVSQASIVENKHLGAVLSYIRERQIERAEARSQSSPRRQEQVNHMFKEPHVQSRLSWIPPPHSQPAPHRLDGIVSRFRFSGADETP